MVKTQAPLSPEKGIYRYLFQYPVKRGFTIRQLCIYFVALFRMNKMWKKSILTFLVLGSLTTHMLAAQSRLDSLLQKLPVSAMDTNRIHLLFAIEKAFLDANNPDTALYYLNQNIKLVEKLKTNRFEYDLAYEHLAVYHAKAEYKKALQYTLKSLEIANRNNNVFQKADSYRALFNTYYNLGEHELAIKYALYSVHLSDSINDTTNLSITYGNLARMYNDLNQYKKAIFYGKKGIEEGKKYRNIKGLLISINNTALAFRNLNQNYMAEKLYKSQLDLALKENFPRSASKAMINLCMLYAQTTNRAKLNQYAHELNEYIQSNKDVRLSTIDKGFLYMINGYNFLFQNRFQQADEEFDKGITLATEDKDPYHLSNFYLLKTKLNYAQQNYTKAEWYNQKYDSVQQLINEDELSKYALDLENKYETQKKEQTIQLQSDQLRNRRILILVLIISIAGILLTALVYYRYYRQKQINQQQRISQLETEKHLTASESVIKGEEQERSRLAKDLHDGLGGMLSGIKYSLGNMKNNLVMTPENAMDFERSIDMLNSSIKEMRRVAHNMMPEALVRYGLDTALRDFCSDINQTGGMKITYQSYGLGETEIEQSKSITIYRIVQELVNNALKHSGGREMLVQLTKADDKLSITVEDDGKGFDVSILDTAQGIGWSNIKSRVQFLKGTIDIHSSVDNGTSVLIEFSIT